MVGDICTHTNRNKDEEWEERAGFYFSHDVDLHSCATTIFSTITEITRCIIDASFWENHRHVTIIKCFPELSVFIDFYHTLLRTCCRSTAEICIKRCSAILGATLEGTDSFWFIFSDSYISLTIWLYCSIAISETDDCIGAWISTESELSIWVLEGIDDLTILHQEHAVTTIWRTDDIHLITILCDLNIFTSSWCISE